MSPQLHPHWDSSDAPKRAYKVSVSQEETQQPEAPKTYASRKPAALVGIGMMALIGFAFFQGFSGILGQLASEQEPDIEIEITEFGFNPVQAIVHAGETISWKNSDEIPHVLASEQIIIEREELSSPPIFPGESFSITLPENMITGTYDYLSETSTFNGQILVQVPGTTPTSSSSSSVSSSSQAPILNSSSSSTSVFSGTQSSSAPSNPFTGNVGNSIPRNPYAVNSGFPQNTGNALDPRDLTQFPENVQPTPRPITQPNSGPSALWVIAILSIAGLIWLMRKQLRSQ